MARVVFYQNLQRLPSGRRGPSWEGAWKLLRERNKMLRETKVQNIVENTRDYEQFQLLINNDESQTNPVKSS